MRSLLLFPVVLAGIFCLASCGDHPRGGIHPHLAELLDGHSPANPYAATPAPAPDGGCTRMRVRGIGGSFARVFNDSNYRHLEYARAGGIKPFDDNISAWNSSEGLVKIESDEYLYIDSLTHSYPYLVPAAADLLEEIGQRFADSLDSRGGGAYRLKVTSLLRSPMTVGRLRRVNRNATAESAHRFGTTFDISYSKFICDDSTGTRLTFEDLKNLLALIIYDLRKEGRCLVKHERKQACFHITAAPADSLIKS